MRVKWSEVPQVIENTVLSKLMYNYKKVEFDLKLVGSDGYKSKLKFSIQLDEFRCDDTWIVNSTYPLVDIVPRLLELLNSK